jgi:hypothetical protein
VPPRIVPSLEDALSGEMRKSSDRVGTRAPDRQPVARPAPAPAAKRANGLMTAEGVGVARGTLCCWLEEDEASDGNRCISRVWRVSQGDVGPPQAPMTRTDGARPLPTSMTPHAFGDETTPRELADALRRATLAEAAVARKDARIADLLDRLVDRSATIQAKDDALDALRVTLQTLRNEAGPRPRVIDATASPPPPAPKPYRSWGSAPQRLWTWLIGSP